ncbi:MAG: SDR family NAD(P)-dependent oxidoreductase, partial [Sandaracinaceae bacterium]|nr:SDR family NAD(P)-dependent oxidoreductase [Sandaracinaceae bacterium]
MTETRHGNALTATLTGVLDQLRARHDIGALEPAVHFEGETVLVTGANSGLGRGIARDLALRRASRVILACRSGIPQTAEELERETKNPNLEMRHVDLADFASIEALVQGLKRDGIVLDRVFFNAGVVSSGGAQTREGFELMFGVNFIANALLTLRLL